MEIKGKASKAFCVIQVTFFLSGKNTGYWDGNKNGNFKGPFSTSPWANGVLVGAIFLLYCFSAGIILFIWVSSNSVVAEDDKL